MLMNKTKRKIFETAMQLFADKGYEATSIEEITATVGVAKGTLYYHFSSKEEIFNFLVEEGMKLLKNSIKIKTDKVSLFFSIFNLRFTDQIIFYSPRSDISSAAEKPTARNKSRSPAAHIRENRFHRSQNPDESECFSRKHPATD